MKRYYCSEDNLGETAQRRDGAQMGLSERDDAILNGNLDSGILVVWHIMV